MIPRESALFPRQESFAAGELDPGLHGAFSSPAYAKGVRLGDNSIFTKYGTILNRPGTEKVAATRYADKKAILRTFDFADNQAYGLEIGDKYLRVYTADRVSVPLTTAGITAVMTDSTRCRSGDLGATWIGPLGLGTLATYSAAGIKPDGSMIVMLAWLNDPASRYCRVSTDGGETTELANAPANGYYNAVKWTGTRWVAVGDNGAIAYTPDPVTTAWTEITVGTADWASIAVGNGGQLLVGGTNGAATLSQVVTSNDHGLNWGAPLNVGTGDGTNYGGASLNGAAWTGVYWVISVTDAAEVAVWRSTDRVTWEKAIGRARPAQTARTPFIDSLSARAGKVAAYLLPDLIAVSFDGGKNWGVITVTAQLGRMEFVANDLIAAVDDTGDDAGIYISLDAGKTWKLGYLWEGAATPIALLGVPTVVAEVGLPYESADLPKLRLTQSGDEVLITCQGHAPRKLRRAGTYAAPSFDLLPGFTDPPVKVVAGLNAAFLNQAGDADHVAKDWEVVVTWEDLYGNESLPSAPLAFNAAIYPDMPASYTWGYVKEAVRYHVFRGRNGEWGYVGSSASTTFNDDGAIPIISDDPPKWQNPFAAEPPAVAAYHEDRLALANVQSGPATIRWSATGNFRDFDESLVSKDDDAFKRTLRTLRYEEIRAMVLLGDLLVFTSEAEWSVRGEGPVSFRNLQADPETYNGSAWVQPITIGKEVLFVQSRGNEVRNLHRSADGWDSDEISALVNHLFKGRTVVEWAYARRPYGIIWVVMSDGALLSLTHDRALNVWAWARHSTLGGLFESVTTVPENGIDAPWFIVKRGAYRYIERMTRRHDLLTAADFCGLDSAKLYTGAATATVTGLDHLNGQTVYGLGDGKVYAGLAPVAGGSVTFPAAAVKWAVGLRVTSQGESLDHPEARTRRKEIARVFLETSAESLPLDASAGIFVGEDLNHLTRVPFSEARQGLLEQIVESSSNPGARIAWKLEDPVPVEIKAIIREVVVGS